MSAGTAQQFSVGELAAIVGGRVVGNADQTITGINTIEGASLHDITFLSNEKYAKHLSQAKAGCIITTDAFTQGAQSQGAQATDKTFIVVDDAYRAFVKVMQLFFPAQTLPVGLRHPLAYIDDDATVHETASIGPGCVVSKHCTVGANTQLIANVVLYPNVQIGERCIIHAGAVIGSDGFGFLENSDGSFEKIPQVGGVVIGNDVEIGANTTIDRGAVAPTVIGNGVKLDNLIHIAHGVRVGDNSAMAAQAGISGSTVLGKRNRIAGQVGVVGHIQTADDVIVEAQSGLSKSVSEPGHYFGSPATDHRTALRIQAAMRRLPELLHEFRELQRIVAGLTEPEA